MRLTDFTLTCLAIATSSFALGFNVRGAVQLLQQDGDPVVVSPKPMRRFELHRTHDPTGQQRRLGVVAEGLEFSDGHVAMRWRSAFDEPEIATLLYADFDQVLTEHCDAGASVHWIDGRP
jgi:hypothetical protein